ncbi:MAG: methyltransferase domain-containing protein, partial [Acidimicrobiales bacterium]
MDGAPCRWNHNVHYHPMILDAVPAGARRALDVGWGDGFLAQELRGRVPEVVAIDRHVPGIEQARPRSGAGGVTF